LIDPTIRLRGIVETAKNINETMLAFSRAELSELAEKLKSQRPLSRTVARRLQINQKSFLIGRRRKSCSCAFS
jgi:hypothetical protein